MKKYTHLFIALLFLVNYSCQPKQETSSPKAKEIAKAGFIANPQLVPEQVVKTLAIGAKAPDFQLPATDGKTYGLNDFKEAEVLVILFTCNHCPTAQAYEERMLKVTDDYKDKKVQVIGISPNSPLGLLYEELGYSDLNDDYEDMKLRVAHKKYNFPYLYDGDDQAVSLQYGPVATPHTFVFDKARILQYVGRLDKLERPDLGGNAEDLRAAIDAVLAGEKPALATTKTFGCSTKWGWKTTMKTKADKAWAEKKVEVSNIDVAGIQTLLKNKDSKKLRLINVWATWCGPCVIEYPEFIVLQRMFGARDFEFVSISADNPDHEEKVLKFLQEKNSAVPNYLFSGTDKYALIEAIDKEWNGALPYTVLVAPNGKIVWSHQGEVDFLALKRTIVDHEMIGRYF